MDCCVKGGGVEEGTSAEPQLSKVFLPGLALSPIHDCGVEYKDAISP
jgi:hypothetical protein